MNEIRAFIGHSFTSEDAELVSKFLKYFDQLRISHPWFKWEHAEPAEPKELANKVLRLLEDKNVFIGICTQKELAISVAELRTAWWPMGLRGALLDRFEWKTSDWIIQEIGLARGREMSLILLMEKGVRKPGGLQGNVEYIQFDRDFPEKSFGKILEMIAALSPVASRIQEADIGIATTSKEDDKAIESEAKALDSAWETPQLDWSRANYESAYFRAIFLDKRELVESLDEAYRATAGAEPHNVASWRAFCLSSRILFGSGATLGELRAIVADNPEDSECIRYLGEALEHYRQYDDAAEAYKSAATKAKDLTLRLRHLRRAIDAYLSERKFDLAKALLSEMRTISSDNNVGEREVLKAQRAFAELHEDDELLIATRERLISLNPDDADERFSVAFKYSEMKNEVMALFHYSSISPRDRGDHTWNNLGVAFAQLNLPVKSIDAYREAEEKGNTLSMSNLANRLIDVGFIKEAKQICDKAILGESVHQNVGTSLNRLLAVREEEDKKERETLAKAIPTSDFYSALGRASAKSEQLDISGTWLGPDCSLHVDCTDRTIRMMGEYERPQGVGLMRLTSVTSISSTTEDKPRRFRVTYTASQTGRAFIGSVVRKRTYPEPGAESYLLPSDDSNSRVLLALNDAATEMQVMELSDGRETKRYVLSRAP